MKDRIARWDRTIILAIHSNHYLKKWDRFTSVLTFLGSGAFSFPFTLYCLWVYWDLGAVLFLSLTCCFVTVQCAKYLFHRWRPYYGMEGIRITDKMDVESSFPSGHSAASFAMAVCLSHYIHFSPVLFLLPGLISYSRVHLGHHYPSDIIFGAIVGITFSLLIIELYSILS